MEDGNCHQVKRDNSLISEGYDYKASQKKSDNFLGLNGDAERHKKSLKTVLPNRLKLPSVEKAPNSDREAIPKLSLKIKKSSKPNDYSIENEVAAKIPKPLITQHSTFRRVAKRPYEDVGVHSFRENGDYRNSISTRPQPVSQRGFQAAATSHRSEHSQKSRKLEASHHPQSDYAQYLGLQPAVKFKCSKCCCSSFQSLGMLKEHQRFCSLTAPARSQPSPLLPLPPLPPSHQPPEPHQQRTRAASPANSNTNFRITRKVYLCSACGTYYENWNLFLHIREVHNRHTCLFCFGMFSQAQKLASHLIVKHNIQEDHFTSKEDLSAKFSDSFYLLCCKCEKVFTERENFIVHECTQVVKQCSVCKVKGSHSPECPKNSKHKQRPGVQLGDVKKVKKNSSVEKKQFSPADPASDTAISSDNISPEKAESALTPHAVLSDALGTAAATSAPQPLPQPLPQPQVQEAIATDPKLDISIHSDIIACHTSPVPKATPMDNCVYKTDQKCTSAERSPNEILKNNNNKEEKMDSSYSETNVDLSESMKGEEAISDTSLTDAAACQLPDTSATFQNSHSYSDNSAISSHNEELSPVIAYDPTNTNSPAENEPAKAALKPPPRNRRPPKRYQFKNNRGPGPGPARKPELPPVNEVKEIVVNRVPKLTVKLPKILTDKESSSEYTSESEDSDKLTVDVDETSDNAQSNPNNESVVCTDNAEECGRPTETESAGAPRTEDCVPRRPDAPPEDIAVAGEDIPLTELTLDRPLDRYPLKDLLRVFLASTVYNCIYCNHARKVAVNAKQLGLHFIAQHRFTATVDSITAEELLPETIILKVRSGLHEVQNIFLNLEGYDTEDKSEMKFYDNFLECFQCFFVTSVHKDLYLHNRKMHQKTILLCIMCKSNFYSYSELLCHLCPGTYVLNCEIQFRCCLCEHDTIPSAFRLMVHLRKRHHACDVCLETCQSQSKLSNHVWKHKLHHLCYRCGIAYRNKPDITKHLFWKHGTESVLCKKCLQKRWPHVYHFCIPPNSFVCEECNLTFSRAVSLKVHKRLHTNDLPYACSEDNCSESFISKKLLKKHENKHMEIAMLPAKQEELSKQPKTPVMDDHLGKVSPEQAPKEMDLNSSVAEGETSSFKNKKSKKNKKTKEKDNLLIDVNLPALNLSESDSSEESESESSKKNEDSMPVDTENVTVTKPDDIVDNILTDDVSMIVDHVDIAPQKDILEDPKPEQPVAGIWDNFKIYQAEVEKQNCIISTPKPRHVCDSDHDYCVIPINEDEHLEEMSVNVTEGTPKSGKKKIKLKKKPKKTDNSSSSDSSSDSDSSCSCGSNCSCSSSSGSSSSSSSSSDSELSSPQKRTKSHKDSDASAVDIMATEESPLRFIAPEPQELPVAESDLETDETETDEDFYDEHPQRLANKILAEKRNQLMLLATVAPVNNGTYLDTSRPVSPERIEEVVKEPRKKVKTKKKKKAKKSQILIKPLPSPTISVTKLNIRPPEEMTVAPNKITISLQTNTVIDKSPAASSVTHSLNSVTSRSEAENKRASKRRRVPNRFYGYSSDEEYALKTHLPPKLEWRKEDLPSPSVIQPPAVPEISSLSEILTREARPVASPKLVFKEPIYSSSDEDSDSSREGVLQINHPVAEMDAGPEVEKSSPVISHPAVGENPFPRPAGVRAAREGESVYCYCRCPYDEVSEMIACDAEGCLIEWFHFECVGIMVPPKGKWFCPNCRKRLDDQDM